MTQDTPDTLELRSVVVDLRGMIGQFRRKLKEQGDPGEFSLAQTGALKHLMEERAMTGTELARAEGMKPQSMGAILASLEERGTVTSAPDPSDGRKTLWSLSDEARHTIAETRALKEDWLARTIRSKLSDTEQRELARGIELLGRLLEP
ncbi:MAG: MarR family transcriptional regulator [Actinomycetota bacterium]|nr:MarR family transcriptional regulator [Actinomycetota bacterium]